VGTQIQQVRGDLPVSITIPSLEELVARAMKSRADYVAEQRALIRYQFEERAARKLRIPEPQVSAGLKRADLASGATPNAPGVTGNGFVVGLSVPIPVFNNGRYEVARYQAEQEQANAQRLRAGSDGNQGARDAEYPARILAEYQRESNPPAP
jgi:cobalt-zinc-cadmium efflux system outer membrane protein